MSKTWFITGTSSGLGRLTTEQLLARGDRVAATLRHPEALDDLAASAADRLWVRHLDVTDTAEVRAVVDAAFTELGEIDVVVSNAGYGTIASVEEASDLQIRRVIDTNLIGSIDLIRAALPHLRAQGRGRIVQISSAGGQAAFPAWSFYHASKWGIEGFCEAVAQEIKPFGIEMTIVEPGATPTGFTDALDTAPEMPQYRDGVAGQVRRAVLGKANPKPSDAGLVVSTIIEAATETPAHLRVPIGPDSFAAVRGAYVARLQEHDAQEARALSVAAKQD